MAGEKKLCALCGKELTMLNKSMKKYQGQHICTKCDMNFAKDKMKEAGDKFRDMKDTVKEGMADLKSEYKKEKSKADMENIPQKKKRNYILGGIGVVILLIIIANVIKDNDDTTNKDVSKPDKKVVEQKEKHEEEVVSKQDKMSDNGYKWFKSSHREKIEFCKIVLNHITSQEYIRGINELTERDIYKGIDAFYREARKKNYKEGLMMSWSDVGALVGLSMREQLRKNQ